MQKGHFRSFAESGRDVHPHSLSSIFFNYKPGFIVIFTSEQLKRTFEAWVGLKVFICEHTSK